MPTLKQRRPSAAAPQWVDLHVVRKPRLQYDLARLYLSFGAGAIEQANNLLERFLQEEAEDHNDAEHNVVAS